MGRLAPQRLIKGNIKLDKQSIKSNSEDYNDGESFKALDKDIIYDSLIKSMGEIFANPKDEKHIVYCSNVEHTEKVYQFFCAMGFDSWMVHGKTKKADRSQYIQAFDNAKAGVMVNCGVLTKGYDCKSITNVILLRVTKSITLYFQMVGRGGRAMEGKTGFTVMDIPNNYLECGNWGLDLNWEYLFKEGKIGKASEAYWECTLCLNINNAKDEECQKCGMQKPKVRQADPKPQNEEGDTGKLSVEEVLFGFDNSIDGIIKRGIENKHKDVSIGYEIKRHFPKEEWCETLNYAREKKGKNKRWFNDIAKKVFGVEILQKWNNGAKYKAIDKIKDGVTDFRGANLEGENFDGLDLSNVDFTGANLEGANFGNVSFNGVRFTGANLKGANFEGSLVMPSLDTFVDFEGANMKGAILLDTDLSEAIEVPLHIRDIAIWDELTVFPEYIE
jgi:hypothetical protein